MSDRNSFKEVTGRHMKTLIQYVPVVARVHGQNHPEFHEVHSLWKEMYQKIENSGSERPELNSAFAGLRKVTDHYTVPGDVCESYEAVYQMLSELDQAYHS